MEYRYDELSIMMLSNNVTRTGGKIADSISLNRDSNRDPDRYQTNLIIMMILVVLER